ncbi:MAG TPA: CHRD domain-containing protein [Nocardioides sp.]
MTALQQRSAIVGASLLAVAAVAAAGAVAQRSDSSDTTRTIAVDLSSAARHDHSSRISEELSGLEEDPAALSTTGSGTFRLTVDEEDLELTYELSYADLEGAVTQAHIHLGGTAQSGGISTFLCSNLGNGPAGTQACPPAPATVKGTITAANVVGPTAQGIGPGEMAELIDAIEADTTYVNVHTTKYPGGEIRSQLDGHGGAEHWDD